MEKDKKYCVYKIVDLRTDEVVYIGKTCEFNNRKSYHFTQDKRPVQKYMLEQGRENFEMSIVEDNLTDNDTAVRIEDDYIVQLKPIMNKQRSGNVYNDNPTGYMREYSREYDKSPKRKDYHKDYNKDYRESHKDYYKEYKRQWRLKKKLENLENKKQDGLF